jgi:hypothetical protein
MGKKTLADILREHPEDRKLFADFGLEDEEQAAPDSESPPEATPENPEMEDLDGGEAEDPFDAEQFYDLELLKDEILTKMLEQELPFEEGPSSVVIDSFDKLDDAYSFFKTESSEEALMIEVEGVCQDLQEKLDLPGSIHAEIVDLDDDKGLTIRFDYTLEDYEELEAAREGLEAEDAFDSFDEVVGALEDEGLHDAARRMHDIMWEND